MSKILIIHHNAQTKNQLTELLEKDGHWVQKMSEGHELPNRVLSHRPDLILLSADLPGENPTATIEQLRKIPLNGTLPIVLLSPKSDLASSGADGCISDEKINPAELKSTIQNLLERPPGKKGKRRFLRYGQLEMDRETRTVRLGVAIVTDLPSKHFELLWLLAKRAVQSKEICPRSLLISKLWKGGVRDREVDVTISRLKTRIPFIASYIETLPGKGYRFLLPSLGPKPAVKSKSSTPIRKRGEIKA